MNASNWIGLLAIVVGLLGIAVPLLIVRGTRHRDEILRLQTEQRLKDEKHAAETQALRDANVDLKIQVAGFQGMARVIDRTFTGLASPPERSGS